MHRSLIGEEHGFTFICCLSIVERVTISLAHAYAAIAIVEKGTGHSTWDEQWSMGIDDMTRGSKDVGRAKHVLIITKRHIDCVKTAYQMVVDAIQGQGVESPAMEPFRFLRNDVEALVMELESLMQRANNQMSVVCVTPAPKIQMSRLTCL